MIRAPRTRGNQGGPRAVFAAYFLACALAWAGAAASGDELALEIILTRHSVRSPLASNEAMAKYASQPWPKWEVAPGIQTPHGNTLTALMGDYYRARLAEAGALSGDPSVDGPRLFVRADNDQRTIETGRILAKALVRVGEPDVHALAEGMTDPLFRPVRAHVGHPDTALAIAAVLGRMGGDPRRVERAYAAQLAELKAVLFGPGAEPKGGSPFDGPAAVVPGEWGSLVTLTGPINAASQCTESLVLEYAEGMPLPDVGWGRADARALTDLLALRELYFDLTQRTYYLSQVGGSNLASHIVDTLEQATLGEPVPGAIGPPGERVVVIVGHDTNIANIGGLFGMNWWIPGTQMNPTLPGGALVFDLWKRAGAQSSFYLRTSYMAQTLDQMREATPLLAGNPPASSPVFIPGCGGAAPLFDAPLASFVRVARRVIDPAFIAEEP
ncbi:MAG TPA: histidine-type phosphatase [Opitutaceae bacterium]|nr:histidine-type phosphatase [Opitutaceae bacterium]